MTRALRQCDTIARVGGDEFVVILEEIHGTRTAQAMAEQLIRAIHVPIALHEATVQVGCSIGIASYPTDGQTANDIIERADAAMYSAKTAGRNRSAFYEAAADTMDEHSRMADELAYALKDGSDLLLHYQPQRFLNAESPTVLEALVRWQHPRFGLLNAAAFIHIADEARLANKLDRWVINEVCRQLAAWKIAGMNVPVTTINVSEQSLRSLGFVNFIVSALAEHDVAVNRLMIEISEHTAEEVDSPLEQVLQDLRAINVGLSISDVGFGHCSIGTLARLPISGLKLSRNISGMDQNAIETLVLSVIAIAKIRTLPVTATGIETETHLQDFRRLGCDYAQGHYLGKPMSAENLAAQRFLLRATA
jgi:diguanylate cyclase (GGDEF)-like protein